MAEVKDGVVWDLTSFFPAFNGPEMLAFKQQLATDISALQEQAAALAPLAMDTLEQWEALVLRTEDIFTRLSHIYSYVGCLGAADARNEEYKKEEAQLALLSAEVGKFDVDLLRGVKDASDEVFDSFLARPKLEGAQHAMRKIRERSLRTMSRDQERLATDLNVDGFHSWGRLYDKLTGKLEFDMIYPDGRTERKPISQWRSLMADADRAIGRAAFECGNRAWQGVEDVCAAALNAISGTRHTLNRYRGIEHFMWWALYQSAITQPSLDAMYQAIYEHIDTAREIFRTKARFMGRRGINWFEREAPLPIAAAGSYSWRDGAAMVSRAFGTAYPALAQYFDRFLETRWLESEQRPGKLPGAFCTGSPLNKEQRVYMTFNGALSDVSTIAHEVGHAWHSWVMRDLRQMAKHYPMTLAETASIFGEQILADGVFSDSTIGDDQKLLMLDQELCGAATLLLDITVRFEFEKAFYEERQQGEVSVSRLKELMVAAQQRVMGDALEEGGEDPLFWASKLHFYITEVSFYNFPYTFGFLLARALYTLFKQDGPGFLPRYEEFLLRTGSGMVEEVAQASIGADTTDPAFWAKSIEGLKPSLKLYKELLAKRK